MRSSPVTAQTAFDRMPALGKDAFNTALAELVAVTGRPVRRAVQIRDNLIALQWSEPVERTGELVVFGVVLDDMATGQRRWMRGMLPARLWPSAKAGTDVLPPAIALRLDLVPADRRVRGLAARVAKALRLTPVAAPLQR